MKSSKARKLKRPVAAAVEVAAPPRQRLWPYAAGLLIALFVVLEVYWPAIRGPFLLDDTYLPYMLPGYSSALTNWIHGVRPLLMFSYWLNFQHAGNQDTFGYHMVNVCLHLFNGFLILLIVRKVLNWANVERWKAGALSIFAAGLFLLHPLQTESVSYIASRSETLSVFWVLAALAVFVCRKSDALSIPRIVAILALFAAAVLTKEHTAVLPVLLLLTDYYWNPGFSPAGIRRNWRLYVPIAAGAVFAGAFVWRVLAAAHSAGFRVQAFTWYQYFFTECRAVCTYLFMFIVPAGQNVDRDFAISRGIFDHLAIVYMIVLAGFSALAWIYRRRFPIASYGWFTFLILIAPTSSFVPILDPFAERRLYLPFIGLLLITVDFLRRWKVSRNALITSLAAVLVIEGALTYQRNELWSSAIALWQDSVSKSPHKLRPRFQLASAYFQAGSCSNAVDEFQKAAQIEPARYDLLLDWALAYDCAGQPDQAIAKLKQAAAIHGSAHVYSQLGMQYGKMGKYPEALDALRAAEKLDPNFAMTYYYLGNIHSIQGDRARAAEDYRHVLALDHQNEPAREALARLGQ
jgi:protein O-mannosyl-transferase